MAALPSDSAGVAEGVGEFHYRIPRSFGGVHPGYHLGRQPGAGQAFRGYGSLFRHPDPRRIDLRASARDPFQQLQVRVFTQHSVLPVVVLGDLTASMGFGQGQPKLHMLADMAAATARSAHRVGDPFCFVGCDHEVRRELLLPLSRRAGVAAALREKLGAAQLHGTDAGGLLAALRFLPAKPALVFLVSDFHLPAALISTLLRRLVSHVVVPVVLWMDQETGPLPRFGIAEVADLESGARRLLLVRPGLEQRLRREYAARRRMLERLFVTHGHRPIFLYDRFETERLTEYFIRGMQ